MLLYELSMNLDTAKAFFMHPPLANKSIILLQIFEVSDKKKNQAYHCVEFP